MTRASAMTDEDFNRLLSLSPTNLTDDDIFYLFKIFSTYDSSRDVNDSDLKVVFPLALEVLKFKGEEAAFYELESKHYAAALESAKNSREPLNELEHSESKRSISGKDLDLEDMRQQLLHYEMQINQLTTELKTCEKELLNERNEIEKLTGTVAVLERENANLKREAASLREEANEQNLLFEPFQESSEAMMDKHQDLMNSVCQKNKHITQLLTDIEILEKENLMLREKLAAAQNSLSLATKHLTELSGELTSLKCSCQEKEEKLVDLEQQNLGLRNQVQEMVQQNVQRDSQLDDFSSSIYNRIKQWQDVLERKNSEIEGLQSKVTELSKPAINLCNYDKNQIIALTDTLNGREVQIAKLQEQLAEATKEINESATLIESLKRDKFKYIKGDDTSGSLKKLKSRFQLAEEKIELLESKLKYAEDDAKAKSEETCEMIVQLREYESGEFGLADAVSELKATRAQCRLREEDALAAVQKANQLQLAAAQLWEQNVVLRNKMNLPPDNDVKMDGLFVINEKEEQSAETLKRHAEQLEHEVWQKMKDRKHFQRVNDVHQNTATLTSHQGSEEPLGTSKEEAVVPEKQNIMSNQGYPVDCCDDESDAPHKRRSLGMEPEGTSAITHCQKEHAVNRQVLPPDVSLDSNISDYIKENEALRKGMHEILDSIRNQDGSSDVQIQSECLERLLDALDQRHVSGWYHPAMRLQAQLLATQGRNALLREQLRAARLEERKAKEESERMKLKLEFMEIPLRYAEKDNYEKPFPRGELPCISSMQNIQDKLYAENAGIFNVPGAGPIEKMNFHLLEVMNEALKTEDMNKSLEEKWDEVSKTYSVMRHEMGLLYMEYAAAKAEWQEQLREAHAQREAAERCAAAGAGDAGDAGDEQRDLRLLLRERSLRLARAERWCAALQASEAALQRRCEQMARDMLETEGAVTRLLALLLCDRLSC